jgi:glycine/D-amino acid oxidase-like deaminating enzyme
MTSGPVQRYELVVVGAGSGGIATALAAARRGLNVALVEAQEGIGGTMVRAGVSVWEPGCGGTGIPFDIYKRLKQIPGAVGVYSFGRHVMWPPPPGVAKFPGGELLIDPTRKYTDTLLRHGVRGLVADRARAKQLWHGVIIEPAPYVRVVERMLAETGRVKVLTGAECVAAQHDAGRVRSVLLSTGLGLEADCFVDASGDVALCRQCGCEVMIGQDARDAFGEAAAPQEANARLNGVSLIFRVTPAADRRVEPLPPDVPEKAWWKPGFVSVSAARMPNGDYVCNMLPTMEGREWMRLGPEAAYAEARRRVFAHWHWMQTNSPEFQGFRLAWIAPMLGVRESWRVRTEYVLRQEDLGRGLPGQTHSDVIAIADHPTDRHGEGGGLGEPEFAYGIPFRCLVPRGWRNLLVACRGAGFSSIAASSCRLTRTMMQLGQAAGTAAALASQHGCDPRDVPVAGLQKALREDHVQLEWPTPPELAAYLADDEAGGD